MNYMYTQFVVLTWADAGDHRHVVDGDVAEAVLADDPLEHNLQKRMV